MKSSIVPLFLAVTFCLPIRADEPDERTVAKLEAENKMLRASVKKSSDATAPLRAKIAQQEKAIKDAEAKHSDEVATLKKTIEGLKKELAAVQVELAKWKPDTGKLNADKSPELTAKRLETFGEKYEGKEVRLLDVRFWEVSDSWIDELPGVTLRTNGLLSTIDLRAREKWVGFATEDSEGESLRFLFAEKKEWAEYLLALKREDRLNIKGIVVRMTGTLGWGVVCTSIEKSSPKKAEKK